MAELLGFDKVRATLKGKLKDRYIGDRLVQGAFVRINVGYTADYAIYVHENLMANHPNGGQAKFLEQPARQMSKELGRIVKDTVKRGGSISQGLMLAGLALQRASQELVPVDTGFLRASAFTRLATSVS